MIIDFKEIPAGNKKGEEQDQFEMFCRDFLEELGFKLLYHVSRGPDGGKDIIVEGKFNAMQKRIKWLVSCKHFAHAKGRKAVGVKDEPSILDRVKAAKCKGFVGMYSTVASSALSQRLFYLRDDIDHELFDHRRIEKRILEGRFRTLFSQYFISSFERHKGLLVEEKRPGRKKSNVIERRVRNDAKNSNEVNTEKCPCLTADDVLRISKTALIIIEVEKIKESYYAADWSKRGDVLDELNKFADHTNFDVADAVFNFLWRVADQTRGGLTKDVAISVYSHALNFFPYSEEESERKRVIELGTRCCHFASDMVYDASIYLMNYEVVMWGLTILKYIYIKGKQENYPELIKLVDEKYDFIIDSLKRPERSDLGNMLELVNTFKADRKQGTLSFPYVSENLMDILYPDRPIKK